MDAEQQLNVLQALEQVSGQKGFGPKWSDASRAEAIAIAKHMLVFGPISNEAWKIFQAAMTIARPTKEGDLEAAVKTYVVTFETECDMDWMED